MGVADVSVAATLTRAAAENNFSPNQRDPTPGAGNGLAGIIEYFKRTEGISKPAIFYQDVATGVNQSASYKIDLEKEAIPVAEIGRASLRERVCKYVSISVVAGPLNTKNTTNNLNHHTPTHSS